jgi:hypothetical protein
MLAPSSHLCREDDKSFVTKENYPRAKLQTHEMLSEIMRFIYFVTQNIISGILRSKSIKFILNLKFQTSRQSLQLGRWLLVGDRCIVYDMVIVMNKYTYVVDVGLLPTSRKYWPSTRWAEWEKHYSEFELAYAKKNKACAAPMYSVYWYALRWRRFVYVLDSQGSIPGRGKLFLLASRPSLGPIKPPVPWTRGVSPGVKRLGREADHLYLVPRWRMVGLYLYYPKRLHGTVLN